MMKVFRGSKPWEEFRKLVEKGDIEGARKKMKQLHAQAAYDFRFYPKESLYPIMVIGCFGNVPMLRMFLTRFPDSLRITTSLGRTVLHFAVLHCNFEVMDELLRRGVDIDAQEDTKQYTPLHLAISRQNKGAVERLLKDNANLELCDSDRLTPKQLAAHLQCKHILNLFEQHKERRGYEKDMHRIAAEQTRQAGEQMDLKERFSRLESQVENIQRWKNETMDRRQRCSSRSTISSGFQSHEDDAILAQGGSVQDRINMFNGNDPTFNPTQNHLTSYQSRQSLNSSLNYSARNLSAVDLGHGFSKGQEISEAEDNLSDLAKIQLRRNYQLLESHLRYDLIKPWLYSNGVLTHMDVECMEPKTPRQQIHFLINEVIMKGDNEKFRLFLQGLEENGYVAIAKKIRDIDEEMSGKSGEKSGFRNMWSHLKRCKSVPNAVGKGCQQPLLSLTEETV